METNPLVGAFLVAVGVIDALIGVVLRARVPAFARVYPLWIASSLLIAGIGVAFLVT
ncbi:hypothetical protein [Oceanithermus desulfurans]|uniref:Uncharacterized protein n=2 Tax=Oceanithermus desulfurans TaxID=227924 RepID=A0A511RJW2_9DEIN|nr:hypothetical protein [Oceanithermus desulfurans]MBB6029399.1 putative Mn2+ efflux pump MntP [Oceanithermus desulfurans]GEM89945.1 hypothetical protein ODE01S_13790 [Oceanithermus desulfurans NBRC 100063]